jgi:hypothetical protein
MTEGRPARKPDPQRRGREAVCLRAASGATICRVITGFNTDVKFRGLVYHVQTEDKGRENPLIETLIYKGGEILASRRLPYAELIGGGDPEKAISHLMEEQHNAMILEVKRGKFTPAAEEPGGEDLSLDEIVLTFLAARAAK